jgi:hypothetical protein
MWLRRRLGQPTLCELDDTSPDAASSAAASPIRDAVVDALSALNAQHRRVVRMHYIHGYDYKETAELLHVSVSAVRGRLDRARDALRKELKHMSRESKGWELTDRDLDAIRAAATVASGDESRPAINAILFSGDGQMAATDTHRLFLYSSSSIGRIPRALVHADLGRALRDGHAGAARARLLLSETDAVLHLAGGKQIRAPLVAEQFPNWQKVVPTEFSLKAIARAGDWIEALALLARQSESGFVTPANHRVVVVLSPEEGRTTMRQGQEPDSPGGLSREVSVSFAAEFGGGGPDLIVALNSVYLEQAILFLGLEADSLVELCANSDLSPLMTRPAGGGRAYLVTMPMQLHDPVQAEPAPAAA